MSIRVPYESRFKRHALVEQLVENMDFEKIQKYMLAKKWMWADYSLDETGRIKQEKDVIPDRQHFESNLIIHLGWSHIPIESSDTYDLEKLVNQEDGFGVSSGGVHTLVNKGNVYAWFGYSADFNVEYGSRNVERTLATGNDGMNETLKAVAYHLLNNPVNDGFIAESDSDRLYKVNSYRATYVVREIEREKHRTFSITALVGNLAQIPIRQSIDHGKDALDL